MGLFHLPFSFMLPQRVAHERGYFEEAGLAVDLIERDRESVDVKYIPSESSLTEAHGVDLYPICKWESIKRTWEMDDGRIVAKGTFADLPYTVFVRSDSSIERPEDLADVSVAVNRRTGQEYTAMRALEVHMSPEDVTLQHFGMPTDRLRALRDGEVAAAILLDPQSTLAEHMGFREVLEFDNHMGIVGGEDVDGTVLDAFMAAYDRAAMEINANPEAYREEYLDMLEKDSRVAPDLFEGIDMDTVRADLTVPRYEVPERADRAELDEQLDWMKERGLVEEGADIDRIVAH
ncbi:nitrate/sulfonate/bicarbonate ABC transporter periplasmic component-like protein [Halalkalicoccus jeotgali B3]|uniref:ABC-type nitrate/sulfonate/bicarbonate transport systems periplasmic components-like protein n=1 Tax=Halalkalicoccus jeotgali (strain DSM 18796 / CECT 7217 / JCM 14584 / KCTC 4019 / B3) TaxID=795797 RepID=D8J9D8_HALJB|nr:ABC-type nitrate/sulfonate/bicarbonate transport systems periplasmic components-like protein [Halalkalicoccus jeotgali B3]ELY40613.1 nitrate/sulfonate/bicarbonate ABC transporter periplasmic component-like protein [Halalkalicoccus jeotgali B3]